MGVILYVYLPSEYEYDKEELLRKFKKFLPTEYYKEVVKVLPDELPYE
jgi:uncharacterized membrane protein